MSFFKWNFLAPTYSVWERNLFPQKRLEEERRLKKKLKKKEREERAKKEGRFLTEKQKQDRMRLNQMLEIMKEQGQGCNSIFTVAVMQ